MNSNETDRNLTTERANNLSRVYSEIIGNKTYKNFDILYLDIPEEDIIKKAHSLGYST